MKALTPREFARMFRVSVRRVRAWIQQGELRAVNVGSPARARWIITASTIEDFERARASAPAPTARRRKRVPVDYYPD